MYAVDEWILNHSSSQQQLPHFWPQIWSRSPLVVDIIDQSGHICRLNSAFTHGCQWDLPQSASHPFGCKLSDIISTEWHCSGDLFDPFFRPNPLLKYSIALLNQLQLSSCRLCSSGRLLAKSLSAYQSASLAQVSNPPLIPSSKSLVRGTSCHRPLSPSLAQPSINSNLFHVATTILNLATLPQAGPCSYIQAPPLPCSFCYILCAREKKWHY